MIDGGEVAFIEQKSMGCSFGIDVRAYDLTPVVEAKGQGSGPGSRAGIGVIDRGEDALVPQKAMAHSSGVEVEAHDPAAVVDADGGGSRPGCRAGIRVIDGGEDAFPPKSTPLVQKEPMVRSVRLSVEAHNLATVVEADGGGSGQGSRGGVRVIDGGEDAVVQQKAVLCSVGIDVLAQDLATVVYARGSSFCDGIGVIDRREDALVQQKSMARERGRVAAVAGRAHHHLHAARSHHLRLGRCRRPGLVPGILSPRRPRVGHGERRAVSSGDRSQPETTDAGAVYKAILTSLPIGRSRLRA